MAPATRASGQQQDPGLGIRLVEAPVSGRDDPRAHIYVIDHVAAGTSFSRRIEVTNGTDDVLEPSLYVAPATIADGTFEVGARDDDGELADWGTIEPGTHSLSPNAAVEATLTIAVPDDAEDGEYYGAALAEVAPVGGEGVQIASRVGIRIYLSVGDGDAPVPDFEISTLTASRRDDGTPVVSASVTNTGGRALDMSGELELDHGPAGLSAGPFPAQLGTTLGIGDTQPVTVVLDEELPNGPWDASLTLRSGRLEKTSTATITFPEPGGTALTFEAAPEDDKTLAGLIASMLLLLVVIGLVLYWWWRRKRRRAREAVDAPA